MISHISYSGKYQVVHFVLKVQQLSPYKEEALLPAQTLAPHHREQTLVDILRPHLQAMLQRPLPLRKQFAIQVVVQPGRLNPPGLPAWRIRHLHWTRRSSSENSADEETGVVLTDVLLGRNAALLQDLHDLNIVGDEHNQASEVEETKCPSTEKPAIKVPDSANAPKAFLCPILHEVMVDPVLAADGHTYERAAIGRRFHKSNASPMTGQRVKSCEVLPNFTIKSMIQEWIDSENSKAG